MRLATRSLFVAALVSCLVIPGVTSVSPTPAAAEPKHAPSVTERTDVAQRAQDSGRVVVSYRAGADRAAIRSRTAKSLGRSVEAAATLATGAQVVTAQGVSATDLATELSKRTDVDWAVPDGRMFSTANPNDPLYGSQWDLHASVAGANAPGAWKRTTGSGSRVAVIDTGITNHPDLKGRWIGGYDFIADAPYARDGNGRDSNPADAGDWLTGTKSDLECYDPDYPDKVRSSWHGTHVAGTIGATTGNNTGIAGVAPKATIVPVRVLGMCGGLESDIADAIVWAAGGKVSGVPTNKYPAKILNMSLGMVGRCSPLMQSAINAARGKGATVVVASGNDGANTANFSPSSCSGVINVGAVGPNGARAPYSNYGSKVTLMAQGGNLDSGNWKDGITSTVNEGATKPTSSYGYASMDGTSMAAPHVAGIAALALSYNPNLSPTQLRNLLLAGTEKMPVACSVGCGVGIADAAKTISRHPKISSISPAKGKLAGGTRVAITGSSLDGATSVTFGSRKGTKLSYSSSSKKLYVTAPKGAARGAVYIKVHTPRGNSKNWSATRFTYA